MLDVRNVDLLKGVVRGHGYLLQRCPVVPVATMMPGAELLVEIVPDTYGFSDICSWRWSEQKGCRG